MGCLLKIHWPTTELQSLTNSHLPVPAALSAPVEQRLGGRRATGEAVLQAGQGHLETEATIGILIPAVMGMRRCQARVVEARGFKRSNKRCPHAPVGAGGQMPKQQLC